MNDNLKLKSSALLIIARILAAVLILALVGTALWGIVDLRSPEEKAADAREEFLSTPRAQAALEGLSYAFARNHNLRPERISVFSAKGNLYVGILFKDVTGLYETTYYNASTNKSITSYEYNNAYNSIASYNNFVGNKKQISTVYENEELQILWEEVLK